MTFREKVRRVFHRSSSSEAHAGKPKVEYYRRHEVPPSKFRGPFDKDHQKRLAAWSFERATVERARSLDLSLSPCATSSEPWANVSDIADDVSLAIDTGMFVTARRVRLLLTLPLPSRRHLGFPHFSSVPRVVRLARLALPYR